MNGIAKPLLLIAMLILANIDGVVAIKRNIAFYDKMWKDRQSDCKTLEPCKDMIPDEALNCINNCTSPACYSKIFSNMPLEDGEIDHDRSRTFTTCMREELKKKKGSRF